MVHSMGLLCFEFTVMGDQDRYATPIYPKVKRKKTKLHNINIKSARGGKEDRNVLASPYTALAHRWTIARARFRRGLSHGTQAASACLSKPWGKE